ncbi:MAG: dihydrolipoamide acetyltransferase family protein [Acidobacteriota bacterium]
MKPIIMPQVGQDIPEAVISRWLKKENERVEKGDVVLVVESDKASFEVEAECSGVLAKVLYQEGERVNVFEPVAYIGEAEELPALQHELSECKEPAPRSVSTSPNLRSVPPSGDDIRQRRPASPSARRLARGQGVALSDIQGTGPGGRIIKRDVLSATVPADPAVAHQELADEEIPFSRMRKVIADRLTLSKRTIPHFHLLMDVDVTDSLAWREDVNATQGSRITITDLVVHAVAQALQAFPRLNAHVEKGRLLVRRRINVGVAVSLEDGLLVPVIADANRLNLREIAELSRRNAEAARRGSVDPRQAGTFTVSSLGMYGVNRFLPIINPPECAILGVGCAQARVMPISGGIGVRQVMTLDLACDHRAVDGAYAAGFLKRIKALLEAAPGA